MCSCKTCSHTKPSESEHCSQSCCSPELTKEREGCLMEVHTVVNGSRGQHLWENEFGKARERLRRRRDRLYDLIKGSKAEGVLKKNPSYGRPTDLWIRYKPHPEMFILMERCPKCNATMEPEDLPQKWRCVGQHTCTLSHTYRGTLSHTNR